MKSIEIREKIPLESMDHGDGSLVPVTLSQREDLQILR
jgi:hypothetical protein